VFQLDRGEDESGGAKTGFGPDSVLGAEIPIQSVDGCIQNQVAIGTGVQMTPDLILDGLREPPL